MKSAASSLQTSSSHRPTTFLATFTIMLLLLALTTGCGSGGNSTQPPKLSGNTTVTVVLSSTANDQLAEFDLEFQSVTLTSQAGKTVNLLSAQQPSEFMHLNGGIEPLVTVSVPQHIYASASISLGGGRIRLCCPRSIGRAGHR